MLYYAAMLLLLANAAVSWLPGMRWKPIGRLIMKLTEPVLMPIRRRIRPIFLTPTAALDISGLVVFIGMTVLYYALIALLKGK